MLKYFQYYFSPLLWSFSSVEKSDFLVCAKNHRMYSTVLVLYSYIGVNILPAKPVSTDFSMYHTHSRFTTLLHAFPDIDYQAYMSQTAFRSQSSILMKD